MKVYIVTSGEYSDYHIDAAFIDKQKAEIFCAANNSREEGYYDTCYIEEYDTADENIEGNLDKVVCQYKFRAVRHRKLYVSDDSWDRCRTPRFLIGSEGVKIDYWRSSGGTERKTIFVSLKEENAEKALKIARDELAKINAGVSGI